MYYTAGTTTAIETIVMEWWAFRKTLIVYASLNFCLYFMYVFVFAHVVVYMLYSFFNIKIAWNFSNSLSQMNITFSSLKLAFLQINTKWVHLTLSNKYTNPWKCTGTFSEFDYRRIAGKLIGVTLISSSL